MLHFRFEAALGLGRLWLHAEQLSLPHPEGHTGWRWELPPDAHWQALWPTPLAPLDGHAITP